MSYLRIEGLTKQFKAKPPTIANDDLDLEIEEGEFLVLLGPSGCGKTTTLRCLAGLETPEAGRISFGDRTVFDCGARINLPPDKRNIGMVFQSYALWPHMTVRKNIGYPLRARRMKSAIAAGQDRGDRRTWSTAETCSTGIPAQLSGGQQQRVALARGLVARPDLVLFDEPLSNLDARLRDQVRAQIHELHQRLGFTAVFVTHDQAEAFALGDRMAIMRAGKIEQFDTPERVFETPGHRVRRRVHRHGEPARARPPARRVDDASGQPRFDAAGVQGDYVSGDAAVGRLRPDDLALRRSLDEVAPGDVGSRRTSSTPSTAVAISTYGRRRRRALVRPRGCGATRALVACSTIGSPVVVSFSAHRSCVYYTPTGTSICRASGLEAAARSEA